MFQMESKEEFLGAGPHRRELKPEIEGEGAEHRASPCHSERSEESARGRKRQGYRFRYSRPNAKEDDSSRSLPSSEAKGSE